MDVGTPILAITDRVEAAALKVLHRTTMPMTGRQIARLASTGTPPSIQAALNRLDEHGLVSVIPAGRANLYTLNREHLALPAIDQLLDLSELLRLRIAAEIEKWEIKPIHAALFGSAARGDGNTESDIDLLLVRNKETDSDNDQWNQQKFDLSSLVRKWTGNHLSQIDWTIAQLLDLRDRGISTYEDIRSQAITIYGPDLRELIPSTPPKGRRGAKTTIKN